MTRRFSLVTLISIAFAGSISLLAEDSVQQTSAAVLQNAEAAFPQGLRYVGTPPSGLGAPVNPYNTCAAVFNQSADGTPDLIAAAYSGYGVEIAMVTYQAGMAQIVDAVQDNWPHHTNKIHQFNFVGGPCEISIENLADPTQSDSLLTRTVKVSFDGQDWYFLWDGKKLRNITALMPGGIPDLNIPPDPNTPPDSYMHTSHLVDVDHKGTMQIIGNGDYRGFDNFPQDDGITETGTKLLFRYNGTVYQLAKILLLSDECEPQPTNWNETTNGPWSGNIGVINMHQAPAPSYRLLLVNGDRDGNNRVRSAKVAINGVTVVSSAEINQGVETLVRTIQLEKENSIKVTVDGPSGSHVYVIVE